MPRVRGSPPDGVPQFSATSAPARWARQPCGRPTRNATSEAHGVPGSGSPRQQIVRRDLPHRRPVEVRSAGCLSHLREDPLDERTLCSRLKAWVDAELRSGSYADLERAETEIHVSGSHKRHDLVIYGPNVIAFTLEVRTPKHPHGASPYDTELVADARAKADDEGLQYFGTFNCASFVLWKVYDPGLPAHRRHIRRWPVVPPQALGYLDGADAEAAIRAFIPILLQELARLRQGQVLSPSGIPEDEIVSLIEDRLHTIVGLTYPEVTLRFGRDAEFKTTVKSWMLNDQQWIWDDSRQDELLLRATQIGCYLLMNQILFYEAMRAKFASLPPLDVGNARSGRGLQERLDARFDAAMRVSRDYETVFSVGWIKQLAYVADGATSAWASLVRGLRDVDLGSVSLDLLGGIFERLLSPEERHQFGQHYTSPELADLLLVATVREKSAKVLDPSSGGGTFLVRAYERKRELGEKDHVALLSDIYGNDLSPFAAHLSVLNLAVRSLAPEENYPRVGKSDFLELTPGSVLLTVPANDGTSLSISLPRAFDAIVGNPPYVRRQNIPEKQWKTVQSSLQSHPLSRPEIHELSDLHTYFWVHAIRFLRPGGMLAFLSSSSWLENTSGSSLKKFLLDEFELILMAESSAEPWFSEARVRTVATVLRKRDAALPATGDVVFANVRVQLAPLFGPRSAPERWKRVSEFLDGLLAGEAEEAICLRVPQAELSDNEPWTNYLRAPEILARWRDLRGVATLGTAYDISVGPKLGGTDFFKLRDVTSAYLDQPDELAAMGVTPRQLAGVRSKYRIVEGMDGWVGPIEGEYLRATLRSPKQEKTRRIGRTSGDLCLFIPRDASLQGKKVRSYISHGEKNGVHRRVYAGGRNPWFSIEHKERGPIIYPHAFQFGHKVFLNESSNHFTTSPNCYLTPHGLSPEAACAALNSTWTYLDAIHAAQRVGVEGNVRFGGLRSWQRLHVLDLSAVSKEQEVNLRALWCRMMAEEVVDFPPAGDAELGGWRRELDELVVTLAGVDDRVAASNLVDELYRWVREYVGGGARVEAMAVASRGQKTRSGGARRLGEQAGEEVDLGAPWLGAVGPEWALVPLPDGSPKLDTQMSLFGEDGRSESASDIRFGSEVVRFASSGQAGFVRTLCAAHLAPQACPVPPPHVAGDLEDSVVAFVGVLSERVREAVKSRVDERDPAFAGALGFALSRTAKRFREYFAARAKEQMAPQMTLGG